MFQNECDNKYSFKNFQSFACFLSNIKQDFIWSSFAFLIKFVKNVTIYKKPFINRR